MSELTRERVFEQLSKVKGPDLEGNIVDLGLVSEVVIANGSVTFALTVDPSRARELEPMREAAEKAVEKLDGVERVMVAL
ncbi:MAG: iron-sulfur cluster assembly protein, partial [Hyphomicrobiales bacterium]